MNADKLLKMKERIDQAEKEAASHAGAIKQLKSQLKSECGMSSVKEARTRFQELDKALAEEEEDLQDRIEALEVQLS